MNRINETDDKKNIQNNDYDINTDLKLIGKKFNKSTEKSIKSSKSDNLYKKRRSSNRAKPVEYVYCDNEGLKVRKFIKKKAYSNDTINLLNDEYNNGKVEIIFDYSSLDNLKARNNLLDPIRYPSRKSLIEDNYDDPNAKKDYKVININNSNIRKPNKSDTIININEIEDENNLEKTIQSKKEHQLIDHKVNINNNEPNDKINKNNALISIENNNKKDDNNDSKEPLIDKSENDDKKKDNQEKNDDNEISEEEYKKRKLIEQYLKMPVRKTGLDCPWSLKQIVGLLIILYSIAVNYYLIFYGSYNTVPKYIILGISSLVIFIFLTFGILLIISDASDDSFAKDKDENKEYCGKYHYCRICKKNVNRKSLHCKYCNKCILRFDHHCKFVNNCIGVKNYRLFVLSLSFSTLYFLIVLLNMIYFFFEFIFTEEELAIRKKNVLNLIIQIGILVYLIITCVAIYFLFDLIRLHILLAIRHMTTNEYSHWLRANRRSLDNRANKKQDDSMKSQEILNAKKSQEVLSKKRDKNKVKEIKKAKKNENNEEMNNDDKLKKRSKINLFEKKSSEKVFPL
ncbi:hypothetical protein H8356DRAFT_1682646 [Neocallimastix lanati (nom. inval.)]|nr:hypothetical protein H8356DRAFT_1682646 [Neocallimastix sp. JGI-2020a]